MLKLERNHNKNLLEGLEMREVKAITTTALPGSARILRRVLEIQEDSLSVKLQLETISKCWCEKLANNNNNNNNNLLMVYAKPRIRPGEREAQTSLVFSDTNESPNLGQTPRPSNNHKKENLPSPQTLPFWLTTE